MAGTEHTGVELMEIEPPPYEEALHMSIPTTPLDGTHRDISPLTTPSPLARLRFAFETVAEEEEEGAESELPGLVSPEPPSYPADTGSTPLSPDSGRPSTAQPLTDRDPDMVRFQEPLCLYLYTGVAGLRMPRTVLREWKIGLRMIMSTGIISNWSRYIFLSVQSILLLGGILFSYFVDFDSDFFRYLRIGVLGAALMVNFFERFSYWCVHALSDLDDNGIWNFWGDLVRLFLTEIFIYVALVTTLFTTSETYVDDFRDFPKNSTQYEEYTRYGYSMVGLMGLLFFLTTFVMRIFSVFSITRSLLKARVNNTSNASLTQKCFLYGLCVHTIAQSTLQGLLSAFIGLVFNQGIGVYLFFLPFIMVFLILAEVVPIMSWCLYFSYTLPWGRYFPLSMLLDLPPDRGQGNLVNMQTVSSWFQTAHNRSMTCKAIFKNYLRPITSPLQYFVHIIFFFAWGYVGLYLIYGAYIYDEGISNSVAIVPTLAVVIMTVFNFPSLLLGLLMILLLPVLGPISLLVCFARTLNSCV